MKWPFVTRSRMEREIARAIRAERAESFNTIYALQHALFSDPQRSALIERANAARMSGKVRELETELVAREKIINGIAEGEGIRR